MALTPEQRRRVAAKWGNANEKERRLHELKKRGAKQVNRCRCGEIAHWRQQVASNTVVFYCQACLPFAARNKLAIVQNTLMFTVAPFFDGDEESAEEAPEE